MTHYLLPSAAPLLRVSALALGLVAVPVLAGTTTVDNPGNGRNRIEVTGNSASRVTVRCADGSTRATGGNVNSVNVDPGALRGRTEIVTGRNVQDLHGTADCDHPTAPASQGAANVNSVNIR